MKNLWFWNTGYVIFFSYTWRGNPCKYVVNYLLMYWWNVLWWFRCFIFFCMNLAILTFQFSHSLPQSANTWHSLSNIPWFHAGSFHCFIVVKKLNIVIWRFETSDKYIFPIFVFRELLKVEPFLDREYRFFIFIAKKTFLFQLVPTRRPYNVKMKQGYSVIKYNCNERNLYYI